MFYVQCDGAHKSRARCHQRHTHTHTQSGTHMRLDGSTQIQLWLCVGEGGREEECKETAAKNLTCPCQSYTQCIAAPASLPYLPVCPHPPLPCPHSLLLPTLLPPPPPPPPLFDSFWVLSVWNAFCNSYFAWKCQTAKCHKLLKKNDSMGWGRQQGQTVDSHV